LHEYAHIVRGDLVVGVVQRLVGMTFWLHPLVHLLNVQIARAREEVCDNYALGHSKPTEYAQTLLSVTQGLTQIHKIPATAHLIPPRWSLEERIAGLLDERRQTMTRTSKWVAVFATVLFMAGAALLGVQDGSKVHLTDGEQAQEAGELARGVFSEFVRVKAGQMQTMSDELDILIPEKYSTFIRSIEHDASWGEVSRLFWQLQSWSGQYEGSKTDPRIRTALWCGPIIELGGMYEQLKNWTPHMLNLYADEILAALPDGSVYFGGTDPGRFVITTYLSADDRTNTVIITQNALADPNYMAYIRHAYGADLILPSKAEVKEVFASYAKRVEAGEFPGRENNVTVNEDGRVQITSALAVMDVNGMLAEKIVAANREKREFYLQESYVLRPLQNHLEPWGPIMRLHPEPIVLTDEMQARDRAYWDALSNRLLGLTSFARDPLAQKAFAELRSAIAGLYRQQGRLEQAEYAYKQAVQLCPIYTGASWGLADLYDRTGRRDEAREVLTRFKALAPERNHKQLEKWLKRLDEQEEKGI